MLRLSFIIPLYNTEKFIAECLSSILDNDTDKSLYEVIVVDDGSTDSSPEIARSFTEKYPNVSLIRQENQGVSVARMRGISHARGNYVWFIDSDDYIISDATRYILDLIQDNPDLDGFVSPMLFSYEDDHESWVSPVFEKSITISGKDLLKNKGFVLVGPPQFIVKRSLFEDRWLFFPTGVRYEDEYYARVLKYRADRFLLLDHYLYVYRQWAGSHMNSLNVESGKDIIAIYRYLDDFAKQEVSSEDQPWFRYNIVSFLLEAFTRNDIHLGTREFNSFFQANVAFIRSEWNAYSHYFPIKERVLARTLLTSPKAYFRILSILRSYKNGILKKTVKS